MEISILHGNPTGAEMDYLLYPTSESGAAQTSLPDGGSAASDGGSANSRSGATLTVDTAPKKSNWLFWLALAGTVKKLIF